MIQIYRSIIVISTSLTIAYWVMPYVDYMWYSNEQLYLLDQGGLGAKLELNEYFYWGTLIAWVLLSAGMFFYKKIARTLYSSLLVVSLFASLLYGVQVLSAYEFFIVSIIGMSDGAILVMAYLTSIGLKFENNS